MAGYNLSGQTVDARDLAALYLTRAGLPNTKTTQLMLAAWFMSESHREGGFKIRVYNNNPLNITTSGSNYHKFDGIGLHFANYSSPAAGADAWANLLQSRKSYRMILKALRAQDPAGFVLAIRNSPWGTNSRLVKSTYQGISGENVKLGDAGNVPNSPNASFASATLISDNLTDEEKRQRALDLLTKAGITNLDPSHVFTHDEAVKIGALYANPQLGAKYWEGKTVADFVGSSIATGDANKDLPLNGLADALGSIGDILDPAKMVPRLVHIGAILLGAFMVGYGIKVMLGSSGSIGGDIQGGGTNLVETRYPFIIEGGGSESPVSGPSALIKPPPVRRRTRNIEYSDPIDNTASIPASNTIAPLKKREA